MITPEEYRRLYERIGSKEHVADLLNISAEHLARRGRGALTITQEAEYALRYLAQRHARPKPRKALPKQNKPRNTREFTRAYGSGQRVAWVKNLPCVVHSAECRGEIENAHIVTGGMGRKADADTIVPLCHHHHDRLHRLGRRTFEIEHGVDLSALAAATARAWKSHDSDSEATQGGWRR